MDMREKRDASVARLYDPEGQGGQTVWMSNRAWDYYIELCQQAVMGVEYDPSIDEIMEACNKIGKQRV